MATKSAPKTIVILHEKKPLTVETVDGYPDSDVTYRKPAGYLASASWRLLFVDEALELADGKTLNAVCDMVGMPREYDWSFIRDADSGVIDLIAETLREKVGPAMASMGLTSEAMTRPAVRR